MTKSPTAVVRFGRAICGDTAQAERREWWLTNGLGAYAGGTVAGSLTRRYHGLLIAPLAPPLGRSLLVVKADASLAAEGAQWPLFTNRWADGVVDPAGHVYIESFHLEGRVPVWHWRLGPLLVEQRVWMQHGANTTFVAFRVREDGDGQPRSLQLRARLLIDYRDHHGTTCVSDAQPAVSRVSDADLRIDYNDALALHVHVFDGVFQPQVSWYEQFHLAAEQGRGLPALEDHLGVGEAVMGLRRDHWCGLRVSLNEPTEQEVLETALRQHQTRDASLLRTAWKAAPVLAKAPQWVQRLILAADSYLVAKRTEHHLDGRSVIAGYPWFGEWGRDALIALPGLTLATGRHSSARRILETFADYVDRGMVPNLCPAHGERPRYNSVDAALWYIEAWRAYSEASEDRAALAGVFPVLAEIIRFYLTGTRHGIHVDEGDGLLAAGEAGVQLTWMDAKDGERVVTPRSGKPVEVNALWYNALMCMVEFADTLGQDPEPYQALAATARNAFQRFSRDSSAGLYDVLDGPDGDDASIRPNQILAVSLPHSPLETDGRARVVDECRRELLCSYGLRSLSPRDPAYRGVYVGDVHERDGAYHQGTVWAWLLGHFALAEYRVHGDPDRAQARLVPMADHLTDAGLGHISEIFDGDAPHMPRGAPAQAWSVACTLEAWWRLERAKRTPRRGG